MCIPRKYCKPKSQRRADYGSGHGPRNSGDDMRPEKQTISAACIGHNELTPQLLGKRGNEVVDGDTISETY